MSLLCWFASQKSNVNSRNCMDRSLERVIRTRNASLSRWKPPLNEKKKLFKKKYWLNQPTEPSVQSMEYIFITLLTWVIGKNGSIVVDSFSKMNYTILINTRQSWWLLYYRSPHGSCYRINHFNGLCHFSYEYIFSFQTLHENDPHWPYFLEHRHRERRGKNMFNVSLSYTHTHTRTLLIIMNQFSNSFLIKFYDAECGEEKNEREKAIVNLPLT